VSSLQKFQRHVVVVTLGFLVLALFCWFVFPYRSQIGGIIVGIAFSLYNFYYLTRKIRLKGEPGLSKAISVLGSGMVHRFLMVVLAIIIALLYPLWIDVRTVIFGIPFCYILVVFVEGYALYKQGTLFRKGVNSVRDGKNT
jgi:hypothetical protein